MREITPGVFIETGYAGVTVGAINWSHGVILIDAPFRADDIRSWRAALLNLGGGIDRLLINLDSHLDRTLGVRALDCTVIGHNCMVEVFRARPLTFKAQPGESGEEWARFNGLGSIRWMPPEITFTRQLTIHRDNSAVIMEHHPGPNPSAIWVSIPEQQIIFIGDTVTPNQPPFLANADLETWLEQLKLLLSAHYKQCLFVSGRGGLVNTEDLRNQLRYLEKVARLMEKLAGRKAAPEETFKHVDCLLEGFDTTEGKAALFRNRLRHGLFTYYSLHYAQDAPPAGVS